MGVYIQDFSGRMDALAAGQMFFDKVVAAKGTEAEVAERARVVAEAIEKVTGEADHSGSFDE